MNFLSIVIICYRRFKQISLVYNNLTINYKYLHREIKKINMTISYKYLLN